LRYEEPDEAKPFMRIGGTADFGITRSTFKEEEG
jgi:hypothetical protein